MVEKLRPNCERLLKPAGWRAIVVVVSAALIAGAVSLYCFLRFRPAQPSSSPALSVNAPTNSAVNALGRLEPRGEVIQLSTSFERVRVDRLLVKEGDRVESGQVIAILDNRNRLLRSLEQAKQQVKVAEARLAQVKAGAKAGDIAAQKATIARLEAELEGSSATQKATIARLSAELRNAQVEYRRYRALYREGAVSASFFDGKRLEMENIQEQLNEAKATLNRIVKTGREQINEAKATLNSIAEVRPTDVQVAQSEVDDAIATVKKAQADLDLVYVRAPIAGQILKIHTRSGEIVGNEGIVELGQTDQMYAIAEVYQSDVGKVSLGQHATITGDAFAGKLQGTVDQIGLKIGKNDVLDTDPAADTDARVVEVKIRLDPTDSRRVAGLTNLQVKVAIDS